MPDNNQSAISSFISIYSHNREAVLSMELEVLGTTGVIRLQNAG
jgi:hypothetical protein